MDQLWLSLTRERYVSMIYDEQSRSSKNKTHVQSLFLLYVIEVNSLPHF